MIPLSSITTYDLSDTNETCIFTRRSKCKFKLQFKHANYSFIQTIYLKGLDELKRMINYQTQLGFAENPRFQKACESNLKCKRKTSNFILSFNVKDKVIVIYFCYRCIQKLPVTEGENPSIAIKETIKDHL